MGLPGTLQRVCAACNCAIPHTAAGGPQLLPLKPRQCLIVAEKDVMVSNFAPVWLDSLYLRLKRSSSTYSSPIMLWVVDAGATYMCNVTIQGDGQRNCTARQVLVARGLYMEGAIRRKAINNNVLFKFLFILYFFFKRRVRQSVTSACIGACSAVLT
jgi:hypothetical protein